MQPTNTSTDENSNFHLEDVLGRCTVGTINADDGESSLRVRGVKLYEVSTSENRFLLLSTLHGRLGQRRDDGRARANTFTKFLGPITSLTDVNRDVRIFRRRGNLTSSKLLPSAELKLYVGIRF